MNDVLVVGAGAAGLLAAIRSAQLGAKTLLIEKTPRIGTKILISGGGKCNITHDCSVKDLLSPFRKNEDHFLRPASYAFTKDHILSMLAEEKIMVYTRPDGRVFPLDGDAKDVAGALRDLLSKSGAGLKLNSRVDGILLRDGRVEGMTCAGEEYLAKTVILAVGGSSYPNSGTTGDGWKWAKAVGHTIVQPRAALAPIEIEPRLPIDWAGVALRDCMLRARQNGKEIVHWRADILFTHRGISGPACLGISREVAEALEAGEVTLEVDTVASMKHEVLASELLAWTQRHPRRFALTAVEECVPNRIAPAVLQAAGIPAEAICAQLTVKQRNRLVETLKSWQLGQASRVPIEKGEVTAGGVSLDEIDPYTMQSKLVQGLYLCGEMIDIAGPVGGYNLQAAFSTGWLAGENAAKAAIPSSV